MEKIVLLVSMLLALPVMAIAQTEEKENTLTVEGYGEVGVHKTDDGWSTIDPHALVGAEYVWKNGWSVFGEVEYTDRLDITQLFIQRSFSESANIRLGKMTAPIGMANVYDDPMDHFSVSLPMGEDAVLPAECNLVGASFLGSYKGWNYEVHGLLSGDSLALLTRLEYAPIDQLSLAVTGFYDGKLVGSLEANYVSDAFITRGIATWSQRGKALHTGIEAGYNIFHTIAKAKGSLIAFARHDFTHEEEDIHRATIGLNYRPMDQLVIKAEFARDFMKGNTQNELAIGIGISLP